MAHDQRQRIEVSDPVDEDVDIYKQPKRRAEFVMPEPKKRRYESGTSTTPLESLQRIMKKVAAQYRYSPLNDGEDIRILIVEKGEGEEEPLRCKLVPSALPSTPNGRRALRYEALSYYWGQEEAKFPITITSFNSGPTASRLSITNVVQRKFHIRPNLHAALMQLRDPKDDIHLWVDAICINQEDLVEKTAQVSRMHEIYSEASSICIWLGVGQIDPQTKSVDAKGTKETFDFIREILNLKSLDKVVTDKTYAGRWLAFVELMRNVWFSRRWVVQELALAKEASVHYGRQVIMWRDFADAVALFITKHDQINALVKAHVVGNPDPIGDMRALGAYALVDATSNLFRKGEDGAILERLLSLEILVSKLLAFEASNPRDTVYAMLSIASDTPYSNSKLAAKSITSAASTPSVAGATPYGDTRVVPNYKKSVAEVCADFVSYCVETSGSLDIICRHWAPEKTRGGRRPSITALSAETQLTMPTWTPLVTGSAFGGPGLGLQGRCNGDSLVGTPSRQNHKNYNASAGLKPSFRIDKHEISRTTSSHQADSPGSYFNPNRPEDDARSTDAAQVDSSQTYTGLLAVKGVYVDTIKKLSQRAAQGMIFQECLELGGWKYDDEASKIPDSLWRTLVADRGPNGTNAPSWYHRACLECFTHITPNGDLSTSTLMGHPDTPSTVVTFLKRVQQVVWNRKFLRSQGAQKGKKTKELFGLAPTSALEGDHICILFGCSVPVILREMKPDDGDPFYYVIGEAYIHGLMDGEALSNHTPDFPYSDCVEFKIR